MKIAINSCFGGFGLSYEAIMLYAKLSNFKLYPYVRDANNKRVEYTEESKGYYQSHISYYKNKVGDEKFDGNSYFHTNYIKRNDPILIKVIEQLGENADGEYSKLKIVEIPDDVEWQIQEYDGDEWIAEKHRTWD